MRYIAMVVLLALGSGVSAAQRARSPTVAVTIEKLSPTAYGFEVTVRVKNVSRRPITLALSGSEKPTLQSLDIQMWDQKLGWESVGPCLDVPPSRTRTLSLQQEILDIVPIGDIAHGWASSVCPRRIQRLRGKVRAVLYCAYNSKSEFEKRMDLSVPCKQVQSPSVDLPK